MNLRERIADSGLKLGWIADQLGVHKTTVRRWKNRGMRPKPEHVERLEALIDAHEVEKALSTGDLGGRKWGCE